MPLRVVTWNLKHGRAVPSAGRDLFDEFAAALAGWDWDVALLQEVPPWWPAPLGGQLHADWRLVLTSRTFGLALRRAVATRWPDLIKSNGGGCNAVLVRRAGGAAGIVEHRVLRLTRLPERRWLIGVRLARDGAPTHGAPTDGGPTDAAPWVGNVHLTGGHGGAAVREAAAAAEAMLSWADGAPTILGGDFNLESLSLPGFSAAASFDVDHVFARGLVPVAEPEVLDRGRLSDHAPVHVTLD